APASRVESSCRAPRNRCCDARSSAAPSRAASFPRRQWDQECRVYSSWEVHVGARKTVYVAGGVNLNSLPRMAQTWLKKQVNALELYTIDVIYGRRAGAGPTLYGAFLQGLSWIFSTVVQARQWLYRHRIFPDQPLGCLVVVVGNL